MEPSDAQELTAAASRAKEAEAEAQTRSSAT